MCVCARARVYLVNLLWTHCLSVTEDHRRPCGQRPDGSRPGGARGLFLQPPGAGGRAGKCPTVKQVLGIPQVGRRTPRAGRRGGDKTGSGGAAAWL